LAQFPTPTRATRTRSSERDLPFCLPFCSDI
jgi:hypothetical protein